MPARIARARDVATRRQCPRRPPEAELGPSGCNISPNAEALIKCPAFTVATVGLRSGPRRGRAAAAAQEVGRDLADAREHLAEEVVVLAAGRCGARDEV